MFSDSELSVLQLDSRIFHYLQLSNAHSKAISIREPVITESTNDNFKPFDQGGSSIDRYLIPDCNERIVQENNLNIHILTHCIGIVQFPYCSPEGTDKLQDVVVFGDQRVGE